MKCRVEIEHLQNTSVPIISKVVINKNSILAEIELRGYNVTAHTILSEDGYYSTVHRIYGSVLSPPNNGKQAILLFHGLGGSGASWIIQPGTILLVDAGYEVRLANGRGSSLSMKHTHLNPNEDLSYWNFSFGEMGTFDLPPIIDRMLRETSNDKVYYVCHSIGCSVYLAGLSEMQELNEKFKAGFLLAPAALYGDAYRAAANFALATVGTPWQQMLFRLLKGRLSGESINQLIKFGGLVTTMKICASFFTQCGICDKALLALYGMDPPQFDFKNIPNILGKSFDNYVLNLFFHASQNFISCGFNKFNYGRKENLRRYGSTQPPKYNLSGITVPTYIFYGEYDNFCTPKDAKRTRNTIPSKYMRGFYRINWPLFNHLDFVIAKDADILIYNRILKL